jgi:hypothetical protein
MDKVKTKKQIEWAVFFLGVILFALLIVQAVVANYNYEKKYLSYWELSDRSSTIIAKEQYITQFVDAINQDRGSFADYNAVFLKTPQNSFDNNLKAVTTLRDRLKDIENMNESDFAYQTAIQQITSQEQGEAGNLLKVIGGTYYLGSYPLQWSWIGGIIYTIIFVLIMIPFAMKLSRINKKYAENLVEAQKKK